MEAIGFIVAIWVFLWAVWQFVKLFHSAVTRITTPCPPPQPPPMRVDYEFDPPTVRNGQSPLYPRELDKSD
jgi:hypothetical protein